MTNDIEKVTKYYPRYYLCWDHEEPEESVREEHLDLLVVAGQVALGVVALVRVGAAPLKPAWGQLVGGQGARAGGETGIFIKSDHVHHYLIITTHLHVMITVFSPSQELCSAITPA